MPLTFSSGVCSFYNQQLNRDVSLSENVPQDPH